MPIIDRQEITAYAACAMQLGEDGLPTFDMDGRPNGLDRCPGYAQAEVRAIRETISYTFIERGGDAMGVENSQERVTWFDLDDRACPFCGEPREISDQVRPQYTNLAGARGGPDVLFHDRRKAREQVEAVTKSADAATRQADALERANDLKAQELALRERELEAQRPTRKPKVPA